MRRSLASFSGRLIDALLARRRRVLVGAAIALAALVAVSLSLRADGRVEAFLPESDRQLGAYVDALHRFGAAEMVVADVESSDTEALHASAATLEAKLRASGLFAAVFGSADVMDFARTANALRPSLPLLLPTEFYGQIEQRLVPDALADRMEEQYERLLSPAGGSYSALFKADPLEIGAIVLDRVAAPPAIAGSRIERRRMVSLDGRHALVAGLAKAPVGRDEDARAITAVMDEASVALLPSARLTWIGGHRFYLANATALRQDIDLVSAAGIAAVLAVVLLGFRNARIGWLAALAIVSAGAFAGATAVLAFDSVSGIAFALGGAFSGITVDYVILLHAPRRVGETRRDAVRRVFVEVLPTVVIGATTSIAAFLVLLASSVPAHRQIGLVSAAAIFGALAFATLVGPVLASAARKDGPSTRAPEISPLERLGAWLLRAVLPRTGVALAVALALVAAAVAALPSVRFENDLRAFECKDAATLDAEARFTATWGDLSSQTMVVVPAADVESALARTERLVTALEPLRGADFRTVSSATNLLPSLATQQSRSAAWRAFWSEERIERARHDLVSVAAEYGIRSDSFGPFFESLSRASTPLTASSFDGTMLEAPLRRYLSAKPGDAQSLVVLAGALAPDDPAAAWPAAVRSAVPEARILTRRGLADAVTDASRRQLLLLAVPGLAVVGLLLVVYYRNVARAAIGLFPLVGGLVITAAVHVVAGIPLSLLNVCVALPIFGLGVDYAVFLIDALEDAPNDADRSGHDSAVAFVSRRSAAILGAALTTMAGGAALLIARHPAVWTLGFALTVGVGSSLLLTWLAVPRLTGWVAGRRQ